MQAHDDCTLSEAEHRQIADAIRSAEKNTSGEIYCVLARISDNYFYPSAFVVVLAILVIGFFTAVGLELLWLGVRLPVFMYALILAVACALLLLSIYPALRIRLVPKRLRYQRAHQAALKQFLARNVHITAQRTGVLIFVSLTERYAEVVADAGINSKVDQSAWNGIVGNLVDHAARDQLAEGFVESIDVVGKLLAEHFPPTRRNPNELDDHLVEI